MTKFRHQRGSLENSLQTTVEVESLNDLKKHLEDYYKRPERPIGNLSCHYYGFDSRINWNTWIICEDGDGIGFCDKELL